MEPRQPDIDELLSGMLDGSLSDAEALRLQKELESSPALQAKLDELSALRSSLLRGRSTGRLKPGFSAGIVAAARSRALEMGSECPDWVLPRESRLDEEPAIPPSLMVEKISVGYGSRVWIPAGALMAAACLGFLMIAFNRLSFPDGGSGGGSSTVGADLVAGDNPSADVSENPLSVGPSSKTEVEKPENRLASGDTPAVSPEKVQTPEKMPNGMEPTQNGLAVNEPSKTETVEKGVGLGEVASNDKNRVDSNDVANAMASNKATAGTDKPKWDANGTIFLLTVVSATMDRQAVESDALNNLLAKHDIASIEDLVLDSKGMESLLTSGLAGSVDAKGVGVYLLKGRTQNLGAAMAEMAGQYNDFPAWSMNIVMDEAAKQLVDQMSDIPIASAKGVAKRLGVKTNNGLVSRFSQGSRPLPATDRDMWKNMKSTALEQALNDISYMLIVIKEVE